MFKNKIKVFALGFCVCLCFIFCGCSNVTYSLIRYDINTIIQQLTVQLDTDKVSNAGVDVLELKNDIKYYVDSYVNNFYSTYMMNLSTLSMLDKNWQYVNLLKNSVQTTSNWLGNTYTCNIVFKSAMDDDLVYIPVENVYYFFYTGEFEYSDDTDDEEDNSTFTDELFIQIYKEVNKTSFDSNLCDSAEEAFTDKYGQYGLSTDDVTYVYKYGQQYSRLHSDADYIEYQDGVYIHTWNLSDKSQPITLYRVYAKPVAWYILALVIGVVSSIVLCIVLPKVKKRKGEKVKND